MTYPTPENVTNMAQMFSYANTVTNSLFGTTVILGVFFVLFVSMKQDYPTARAFGASSFITAVIATLFYWMSLIGGFVFFLSVICASGSLVFLLLNRDR